MAKETTSWGTVADWYDSHLKEDKDSYQRKLILPNLLRIMAITPGQKVLDVACGSGFFSKAFSEAGALVTGVDISPELIALAQKNAPDGRFYAVKSHELSIIPSHSIDKISIILALQNIEKAKETLVECRRVLKTSGQLFVVLNHPAFRIPKASSWEWDDEQNIQYRRIDAYMSESKTPIIMHPGKSSETTVSFHRPLQFYMKSLFGSGFLLGRFEEWISHKTSEPGGRSVAENRARKEFPLFLMMEAIAIEK